MRRYLYPVLLGAGLLAAAMMASGCDRGGRPKLIDHPAPQFTLNDGGKNLDLAQMRGRVVVLHFWGSWCAPCLGELRPLMEMQAALPQVSVVMIGVPNSDMQDGDEASYRQFLIQHPLTVTNLFDADARVNKIYGSAAFPETYIIDKKGLVRRKFVGSQSWTTPDLEDYLKNLSNEQA